MFPKLEVNFDVDARKGDELAVANSELSDGKQHLIFPQAERAENEDRRHQCMIIISHTIHGTDILTYIACR